MPKLELRKSVNPDDLAKIIAQPRDIERASEFSVATLPGIVRQYATRGGTLFEEGEPIIAGGITIIKNPYAVAWLVASRPLKQYLKVVLPEVKRTLAEAEGLTVIAQVTEGLAPAEKFITKLGFIPGKKFSERTRSYHKA